MAKENKKAEQKEQKEQKEEYVVIGWIRPVKDSDGNVHEKVVRVDINGIMLISSLEKMLNGEIEAVPIKTTNVKNE